MNRERQLLHAWLSFATQVSIDPMHEKLYKTTKEFLDKPEQEPLSDEEICEILLKKEWKDFVELVREIEGLHWDRRIR